MVAMLIAGLCHLNLVVSYARAQETRKSDGVGVPAGEWREAAAMAERREYAGGVRLNDGRILAVSGHPLDGKSIASAEFYDPTTDKWSDTGSLRHARNGGNEATRLHDGRVLLAGGHSNSAVLRSAEIYDPKTGQWSEAGNLSVGRDPTAILLKDGRVLVSGGIDWYIGSGKVYPLAEIYDPVTGQWTITGALRTARYAHKGIALDDGRALVVGGYEPGDALLASTELYDPATELWQSTGSLPSRRVAFGLAKLTDGRVLVAGGFTGDNWKKRTNVASAALYDPKSGLWVETAPMNEERAGFSITLLPDGRVLVAGGWKSNGLELKSAEVFDPALESWHSAASMSIGRRNHRATLLPDGSVLVIGGSNLLGGNYLTSCEIFSF